MELRVNSRLDPLFPNCVYVAMVRYFNKKGKTNHERLNDNTKNLLQSSRLYLLAKKGRPCTITTLSKTIGLE